MNWILVIVLAILIFCAVRGWNRGLLRMLFSLVSVIVLIGLVAYATPHVSNFVKEHTGAYDKIQEYCTDAVQRRAESGLEDAVGQTDNTHEKGGLPDKVTSYIMGTGESVLEQSGMYEAVGSKAADVILSGIAFFITLILALILVNIIGKALDIVNKIPIIKGINRTLGIFAGVLQGFIIIWLIFMFLAMISGTSYGKICIDYIDSNPFLEYLYYNNVLLEIFSSLFR